MEAEDSSDSDESSPNPEKAPSSEEERGRKTKVQVRVGMLEVEVEGGEKGRKGDKLLKEDGIGFGLEVKGGRGSKDVEDEEGGDGWEEVDVGYAREGPWDVEEEADPKPLQDPVERGRREVPFNGDGVYDVSLVTSSDNLPFRDEDNPDAERRNGAGRSTPILPAVDWIPRRRSLLEDDGDDGKRLLKYLVWRVGELEREEEDCRQQRRTQANLDRLGLKDEGEDIDVLLSTTTNQLSSSAIRCRILIESWSIMERDEEQWS